MTADRRLRSSLPPAGLFARVAAPPVEDGVMVRIPFLDGEMRHGPCRGWPARPDGRAPERDDPCLVVEDERGGLWIAAWVAGGESQTPTPRTPRVTELPDNPSDGDEVIYVVSPAVEWHLKYDAGEATTYRWKVLGGAPIEVTLAGSIAVTLTSAAFVAQSLGLPNVAVPRAGVYDIEWGCRAATKNTLGGTHQLNLHIQKNDGTNTQTAAFLVAVDQFSASSLHGLEVDHTHAALPYSWRLAVAGNTTTASAFTVYYPYLRLIPKKVA